MVSRNVRCVSFDFDSTLWDEDNCAFIQETLDLLRSFKTNGFRVIIVTSRFEKEISEVKNLTNKIGLSLDIFSAPGNPVETAPAEEKVTKSEVLIREGAEIHFDDLIQDIDLKLAIDFGIKVKLPPATKATIAKMYG